MNKKFCVLILTFYLCLISFVSAEDWMPDTTLRHVVREHLEIPDGSPLHPDDLLRLHDLITEDPRIESLDGLEYAVNLEFLHIGRTAVSDISPLAGLENLRVLKLFANRITDITPLTGLIHLQVLELQDNQIADISPLAGLVNLKRLNLGENQIVDFASLLNLIKLEWLFIGGNLNSGIGQFVSADPAIIQALRATICDFERPLYTLSIKERIQNRGYPSVAIGFSFFFGNKTDLAPIEQVSLADLSYNISPLEPLPSLGFSETPFGVARVGNIAAAKQGHAAVLRRNPNRIFLVEIAYFDGRRFGFKEDFPYWLRNPDGTIARRVWYVDAEGNESSEPLVDFTKTQVQEMIFAQAIAVAKCGLYDGIVLDRWHESGEYDLRLHFPLEMELTARDQILQGIRERVPDDFLIIVNATWSKIPRWASLVNGVFMETWGEPDPGTMENQGDRYTHQRFREFEDALIWNEANLREPNFIVLLGKFPSYRDIHSLKSLQTMRTFTALSLTHSDGYVTMGKHGFSGIYYDFYDADLGQPIGAKAQLYENIEGLFIREFTNGWAVYNRSGKAQAIRLPVETTGVSSQIADTQHEIPDLDGEIYLKLDLPPNSDVNADGVVNILDLVIVANAFGAATPDLNGDGVVNILDLVIVANNF